MQDAAMYLLPIWIVSNLQMPRMQKIALAALLCVGLVAVAGACKSPTTDFSGYLLRTAGCVRFYYVLFLSNEADIWSVT